MKLPNDMLFRHVIDVNDYIHIPIPTVGEALEYEDVYDSLVFVLTATPYDMMVQLDDMGFDYTEITEYEMFLLFWAYVANSDTRLIFGDLDCSKFQFAQDVNTGMIVLRDNENDYTIDQGIQIDIANALRKINHLTKNHRKPGNEDAKEYLLKRARARQRAAARKPHESQLESTICAMVNAPEFKYDYESVKGLTIYQFNESVRQVIHRVDYDKRMIGVYAGTVDASKLSNDAFNWLTHK